MVLQHRATNTQHQVTERIIPEVQRSQNFGPQGRDAAYFFVEGSHPVVYGQLFTVLVPSLHNI